MIPASGLAETGVVHKSAHPSLPPAAPQQVVQYLLAKNFHLTALELLVEAQQAGHGEDVRDLEAFFSDPERFPPEELARYQPDKAFDLQAVGRERESRLQLAEYELRLAKEDLAEMARKLAQAQEQLQGAGGAAPGAGALLSSGTAAGAASPFSPALGPAPPAAASPGVSTASAAAGREGGLAVVGPRPSNQLPPQLSSTSFKGGLGPAPSPAELRVINAAVFAHLQRQGFVTTAMTMEEEYGGPLRPTGPHAGPTAATPAHGADTEHGDLWSWYQAAAAREAASAAAAPAAAAAAAAAGTPPLAEGAGWGASPAAGGGDAAAVAANALLQDLVILYNLGADLEPELESGGISIDLEAASPEELRGKLLALRRLLAETRGRAREALAAAQQRLMRSAPATPKMSAALPSPPVAVQGGFLTEDAAVLDLLDLGSSAASALQSEPTLSATAIVTNGAAAGSDGGPPRGASRDVLCASPSDIGDAGAIPSRSTTVTSMGELEQGTTKALSNRGSGDPSGPGATSPGPGLCRPPWLREVDPNYHASLEALVGRLCETLPKLVPNLTIKSRVDVLPLIVAAAKTVNDWSVRQHLLAAVFNLAPAPDHQQRQAIIDACLELCRAFGSGWAATELVQLCCRQASSPSSERRTLVAEALGAAVGAVDPGTQAHVLLTQLSQLAKDRLEQVREAACHSLARLVPRLPFSRSYYSTLETMLLALAMDGSEAVHSAALSYLVPALLTWQPQDTDSVLVSSCLARVLSEISQQVRIIEHQQHQQQRAATAAAAAAAADTAAASSGGTTGPSSFGGTFLRYSLTGSSQQSLAAAPPPPHSGTAAPAADPSTVLPSGTSTSGRESSGQVPPPLLSVSFGRRVFPSVSHLSLYQLLALYGGLTPALRHAALRSRPSWAALSSNGLIASTPEPSQAHPDHHTRHRRTGSLGAPSFSASTDATPGDTLREPSGLISPTHRRTSSHPPIFGLTAAAPPDASDAAGWGSRHSVRCTALYGGDLPPLPQTPLDLTAGSEVDALDLSQHIDGSLGGSPDRISPSSRKGPREGTQGEGQGPQHPHHPQHPPMDAGASPVAAVAAGRDQERAEQDAALAAWATHPSHNSWKTLEWVMQHVVPELLRLLGVVGPAFPEAVEVRRQAASAVAATCSSLGVPFARAAVLPVFLVASGTGGLGTLEYDAPVAVRDVCAASQPRTPEALRTARQCVLPVLLEAVLPAAQQLRHYLEQLMGTAHEMRHRWLMEALPEYTAAITFACNVRPDLTAEILRVFEDLLSGKAQQGATGLPSPQRQQQQQPGTTTPGSTATSAPPAAAGDATQGGVREPDGAALTAVPAAPAGPASPAVGLCCAALARALVPVASLEMAGRRLLPGLMALMSYSEPELQRSCVGVLAELGLRFRGDGPRVSEQVLVVYDSLLEQGSHAVQLEVLAAGTALAAAAAPSAAVSAAAASQVEWLLSAVQAVAMRLLAPAAATAAGGAGPMAPEHQRALAAQLLAALRAVAPHDLRLPRLQAHLSSALDALQRCKSLLPDSQQQAALVALLKERPTGHSTGASVSSSATATTTNAAVTPARSGPPLPPPFASPSSSAAIGAATATAVAATCSFATPTQTGGAQPHTAQQTPGAGGGSAAAATASTPDGNAQGAGAQLRSRFDAFKLRLLKRKDEPSAASQPGSGFSERPKESFFSDDEGD